MSDKWEFRYVRLFLDTSDWEDFSPPPVAPLLHDLYQRISELGREGWEPVGQIDPATAYATYSLLMMKRRLPE